MQLIKDRRVFEGRITIMEEQCNKMMVQKFGRVVDLEKLETVTVNRQIEELKEKLRLSEIQCSNELQLWDVSHYLFYGNTHTDTILHTCQHQAFGFHFGVSVTFGDKENSHIWPSNYQNVRFNLSIIKTRWWVIIDIAIQN